MSHSPAQFRSTVIYQIYPKSFYSAYGRPTGDIRGIIEKVPLCGIAGGGHGVVQPVLRLAPAR